MPSASSNSAVPHSDGQASEHGVGGGGGGNRSSSALGSQYLEMERAFKRSVRSWSKPSPQFCSQTPRLENPRPLYTQADYCPKVATIEYNVKAARRVPAIAFISATRQRPAVKPLPTDAVYDPRPINRPRTAAAPFKSTTPRLPATRHLDPGQEVLIAPKEPSDRLHKGAVALLSRQPRLAEPAPAACDVVYSLKGMSDGVRKRPKSSTWAVSSTQQRPSVKPATDLMYNVRHPKELAVAAKAHSTARAAFASTTPRLLEPRSITPSPGAYTSKFISCGMLP